MTKIIAEVCQNHLGDREILGRMIKEAAVAGADYVKGQIIFAEDLTNRERFDDGYIKNNGVVKTIKRPYAQEYERLAKLDLAEDDYKWFIDEAVKNKIVPLMTIFSRKRIEFAAKLPWPEKIVKVASYDCASHAMIKELCDVFDHLIVSTGATTDEEIIETVKIIKDKGKKATFLHCVTSYPNTLEMCNFARLKWLKNYSDQVGWSDHTKVENDGLKASMIAAMFGADYIERHFTSLNKSETKDGPISLNVEELRRLVDFCRLPRAEQSQRVEAEMPEWRIAVGQEKRKLTHEEMLNRDYYRGRFASRVGDKWIYNWEDKAIN
ncbi:MAG: N-acetylneuraminate synthase family protein [Patescibacteria group bacterium]|nr:N-acetylneuraminate synthase family protein [Patescibacteria group bacterium]